MSKQDDRKFTQSQKNVQLSSNQYIDINDNQEDYDRKSSKYQTLDYDKDSKEDKLSMKSIDVILNEENVLLLDPDVIKDEKTQALILAVLVYFRFRKMQFKILIFFLIIFSYKRQHW